MSTYLAAPTRPIDDISSSVSALRNERRCRLYTTADEVPREESSLPLAAEEHVGNRCHLGRPSGQQRRPSQKSVA